MGNSSSCRIEDGILFVTLAGKLDKSKILSMLHGTYKTEGYRPDMNRIWDFRDVTDISLSRDDLYEIVHVAKVNQSKMKNYRVAFVAERNLVYGLSRMFSALGDNLPTEKMSFRDIDEAYKWVSDTVEVSNEAS